MVTSALPPSPLARRSAPALGVLLVLISAAAFGSGPLLVQPLYAAGMTAPVVLVWRFLIAAIASWAFLLALPRARAGLRVLPRRRVGALLLLGVLYVGNSFAFFASLQVVPISLASIVAYLYPAIVAVMAIRLVRRLQGRRAWLALAIAMVGVILTIGGVPEGELPPLWGLALAFVNPFIYATWIVLQARLTGDRPDPVPIADPPPAADLPPADAETVAEAPGHAAAGALMTSATAAVYVVVVLVSGASLSPAAVPSDVWLPLLALGLVATALAIQTFYAGVTRVGGARASLISTVEPVYTIVLAMLLFGEQLTMVQIAGGLLVLLGVLLAESGRPDRAEPATGMPAATSAVAPAPRAVAR